MTDLNLPERHVFMGPASPFKRLLAFFVDLAVIDFFVLGFYTEIISRLLGNSTDIMSTYYMLTAQTGRADAIILIFTLIITLTLAYFVLMQYATGQTLGAMLLNLHVVSPVNDKEYTLPGFWQCMMRNIFIIPAMPFVLLWIADPIYFFYAKKGQRLTEWLSRTKVIEQYIG
jgi:uncharacterized RDD family membrane protein YckC